MQRLRIGVIKDNPRRPSTRLTHADLVVALHRCKYDLASAEASLGALKRHRESKYNAACSESTSDDATQDGASAENKATAGEGAVTTKSTLKREGESPKGNRGWQSGEGGNRWEDWSKGDKGAFLAHLEDKVSS